MGCRRYRRRRGLAGLAAASASAAAGARTVVLASEPSTPGTRPAAVVCSASLGLPVAGEIELPVQGRDHVGHVHPQGRAGVRPLEPGAAARDGDARGIRRGAARPGRGNGAVVRQRVQVRAIEQADGRATARLADGSAVTATVLIGADGSSGVTPGTSARSSRRLTSALSSRSRAGRDRPRWAGRLLLDWGEIPGSYGWVFPKGDRLTVGVIAARGQGDATKAYLREFVGRLGLGGYPRSGTPATSPAAGPRGPRCAGGT